MQSKELSMQVKQAILKLQKQKKPIREIATILGVAKSTVWYILRKKESTGELINAKRPGRSRKTTMVDDHRIISMVKRNPFTTANQVTNTLQEIIRSLFNPEFEDLIRCNREHPDKRFSGQRALKASVSLLAAEAYTHSPVSHNERLGEKDFTLNAAEERCLLFEKQLCYMRKMILHAEVDKNTIMDQQAFLKKDNIQDKLEKLELLEKECLRLTATQQIAESKIHQLEEKLHAEEKHRKLLQDKVFQGWSRIFITVMSGNYDCPVQEEAAGAGEPGTAQRQEQLETVPEVNPILASASAENTSQKKVKKKKPVQKKPAESKSSTLEPKISVKAGDLPFVAGKSTSTSHSLSANVQSVLHMMKHRSQSPAVATQRSRSAGHKPCPSSLGANRTSVMYAAHCTGDSLSDLLLDLQGELEQMSFTDITSTAMQPIGELSGARVAVIGCNVIQGTSALQTIADPDCNGRDSALDLGLERRSLMCTSSRVPVPPSVVGPPEISNILCDYQELLKQINDTKDNDLREDLEREMDCLVKQMETKSDQILKLKRHQANVIRLKKAARSMKKLSSNARRAVAGEACKADVPTTLRKKEIPHTPRKSEETLSRSTLTPSSKASLQLLKSVQKIQMTLKKDDIMWEK
ncbi:unnamed protein product [Ranitomeya imitator]|uniref:Centrosomal protein 57kDa-like protein 1 n=1 Tax=Ranitomeya imitator TaxID=111125 RepID=A0ABN9LEW6_9NEOB|nr:unnamed protein product [Ranitomeya imitator]